MTEPIIEFKNKRELNASLKYWKNILFLNDWTINAEIKDKLTDSEVASFGQITCYYVLQAAKMELLSIKAFKELKILAIQKQCQELTLVHELLHCKYNFISDGDIFKDSYYDLTEHAKLEQMAKSLIMVKYNLKFDWFNDFKNNSK